MLSYILAVVGLAVAVPSAAVLMKRSLNHRAANQMLVKLATNGNVDRMRKLCRVVDGKGTYFDAIDAAVEAGVKAGTRDPVALEEVVDAAYDRVGLEVGARWKSHAERGLLGVILVGAGFGLAVSDGSLPTPLLVLCGAGALVGVYLAMKRNDMVEALIDGRASVLPALIEALSKAAPAAAAAEPAPANQAPVPAKAEPAAAGPLRVRIHRGDQLVRVQTLDNTVNKIGRIGASHIQLVHDDVSRMHAVIERSDEGVAVIDLGSAIGTIVNGQKVNKQSLHVGDVIEIGPFRLELVGADDEHAN